MPGERNAKLGPLQTNACASGGFCETQEISERKPPTAEAWKGKEMGGPLLRRCRASPLSHAGQRLDDQNRRRAIARRVHALGERQQPAGTGRSSAGPAPRVRGTGVLAVPTRQVETIDAGNLRKPDQTSHPGRARGRGAEAFLAAVAPGLSGAQGRFGIIVFGGGSSALGPERHFRDGGGRKDDCSKPGDSALHAEVCAARQNSRDDAAGG